MADKSMIPDLIFGDARLRRVREIGDLYCRKQLFARAGPAALNRATVFATHRCNFRCVYCNGPQVNRALPRERKRDLLSREVTPALFGKLLGEWKESGLKFVHFTGGEATLNRHLPEFIRMATAQGMASALTTNGSAGPEVYAGMVESGLKEIRISIDSHDPDTFDRTVRVKGAFRRVEKTIRELVNMRDLGRDVFIIFNVCMQDFDLERCKGTVSGLLRYRPDDMKLLVIAEDAGLIEKKASRAAVEELLALVRGINPAGYGLLERKIRTLFRKDSFGLKGMAVRHLMNHCLVPVTERTVDGKYVYPCSIYVRYDGEPLAPVTACMEEEQAASAVFSENHNCRRDPICSANCTTCCRDFNVEANRRIDKIRILNLARKYPVINMPPITDKEAEKVRQRFVEINRIEIREEYPFFVIKPLGVPRKKEIVKYLKSQGVEILRTDRIRNWPEFTQFLYFKEKYLEDPARVKFKIACNKAFRQLEKPGGFVLRLGKAVPFSKMYRIKSELRSWFGDGHRVMKYSNELVTLHLNAVHAPDTVDVGWQNRVIEYFTRPGNGSGTGSDSRIAGGTDYIPVSVVGARHGVPLRRET